MSAPRSDSGQNQQEDGRGRPEVRYWVNTRGRAETPELRLLANTGSQRINPADHPPRPHFDVDIVGCLGGAQVTRFFGRF